jgi:hypothetical protein
MLEGADLIFLGGSGEADYFNVTMAFNWEEIVNWENRRHGQSG